MKFMVLGSKGVVGTAISKALERASIDYVELSHADLDITNELDVSMAIGEYSPNVIVNCAGIVGIRPCESNPQKAFNVNVVGVSNIIRGCIAHSDGNIVVAQISSHTIFDGGKNDFYYEDDIPNPLQIYGITKYASELVTKTYRRHYIFRLPTLFGDTRTGRVGFPMRCIDLLKEGKSVTVSIDKLDSPSWSDDVAERIVTMINSDASFGLYHISNAGGVSFNRFFIEIAKILGVNESMVHGAYEYQYDSAAPNALKTMMGSRLTPSLRQWEDALKEYLQGSNNE